MIDQIEIKNLQIDLDNLGFQYSLIPGFHFGWGPDLSDVPQSDLSLCLTHDAFERIVHKLRKNYRECNREKDHYYLVDDVSVLTEPQLPVLILPPSMKILDSSGIRIIPVLMLEKKENSEEVLYRVETQDYSFSGGYYSTEELHQNNLKFANLLLSMDF